MKNTLHLPSSKLDMKANLSIKEPLLVSKWQKMHLYEKMNENRSSCDEFMLHDGPPYANGSIHCGHALNAALKDFVVRSRSMMGYKTPYVFGWDTHGLPIEVKVSASGVDRKAISPSEFRELCKQYALGQVQSQKEGFQRLGCLGDYDHPYLTLNKEYEASQIRVFAKMALNGLIFKGLKPVHWSPSSESALAEAEIEYKDVKASTIYVAFKVINGKQLLDNDDKVVIWTTTPWTLPANLAVALNPYFSYGLFATDKGNLLLLTDLKDAIKEELGLKKMKLLKQFKGRELEGIELAHPFYERISPIILAEYVSSDSGTGCVHIAPGHGLDDYNACLKYKIKPYCPVDEKGYMRLEKDDPLNGLFYEEANEKVLQILRDNGSLLFEKEIIHSYPHDWRTKKPVIFRATPQWFCSIEPIREKLLDAVKTINWIPSWGEGKMENMIKDRQDWCISRQRLWGVPIPIIYNEDNSPIIDGKVFEHIASIIEERGSNAWFELTAKELLPEGYTNPASPKGNFTKEKDILDVWFDSGSSFAGVLKDRGLKYPADLYLEGNDQYRGWFNASLILSVATEGISPFKTCLTHGFVMDETWKKMSKSSGNGIDPAKIMNEYGADVLRIWAASVDYKADAPLGEKTINTAIDNYRKIRNTFRFMLGCLDEFVPSKDDFVPSHIDTLVLSRLEEAKNKAVKGYLDYDFSSVLSALTTLLSSDMSSFYLDQAKDILYCDSISSTRRKAIQTVVYEVVKTCCLLLNPIIPFTMEEIYALLPGEKKESPQLDDLPILTHLFSTKEKNDYDHFMDIRSLGLKALEEKRALGEIGSPIEAKLTLILSREDLEFLKGFSNEELAQSFKVSHLMLEEGETSAVASKDEGHQCSRCRKFVDETFIYHDEEVCDRCLNALKEDFKNE